MTLELTEQEAVARATRLQEAKIDAVRALARSRQALTQATQEATRRLAEVEQRNAELVGAAEQEDARLYLAATRAGWSPSELKKIGLEESPKVGRVRRKKARNQPAVAPVGGSDEPQS